MSRPKGKDRIIVALDVSSLERAERLVKDLTPYVGMFKIGLQLITSVGLPQIVAWFEKMGGSPGMLFADLKLHDIPTTIGNATLAASELSVGMVNVHASSGIDGMMAAAKNSKSVRPDTGGPEQYRDTLVLAVTILTSLDENQCEEIYGTDPLTKVMRMAVMAYEAGVDGIICSPREINHIRTIPQLNQMLLVTPGMRPTWAAAGDQKRIMTPGEAVKVGGDYFVIGRPITNPPSEIGSPPKAAQLIAEEIEKAEKEMAERK
jgi:orotidine-5'-phosphate decarboxylase